MNLGSSGFRGQGLCYQARISTFLPSCSSLPLSPTSALSLNTGSLYIAQAELDIFSSHESTYQKLSICHSAQKCLPLFNTAIWQLMPVSLTRMLSVPGLRFVCVLMHVEADILLFGTAFITGPGITM